LTSAILLKERKKETKHNLLNQDLLLLFSLAKKSQVAEMTVLQNRSLPPKQEFSCTQLPSKGSFTEICTPVKQVFSL